MRVFQVAKQVLGEHFQTWFYWLSCNSFLPVFTRKGAMLAASAVSPGPKSIWVRNPATITRTPPAMLKPRLLPSFLRSSSFSWYRLLPLFLAMPKTGHQLTYKPLFKVCVLSWFREPHQLTAFSLRSFYEQHLLE